MRAPLSALLVIASCGRHHFDATYDGGHDAIDLADATQPDTDLGPFAAPAQLTTLGSAAFEDDITLTGDMLEVYFASTRPGGLDTNGDLWMSTRSTIADPWGTPVLVPNVNSNVEDQSVGVSADGLVLYFSSRRTAPLTGANIWVATRAQRTDPWGMPVLDMDLSSNLEDFEAQPDPSNLRLVMYRHISGTQRVLFESRRTSTTAPWGTPTPISELDAPDSERSPCLTDDGLTIYFSSDRESGTVDLHDIFIARRSGLSSPFGAPEQVDNINDPASDDDDPWVSADGRHLFFHSIRGGNGELWHAQR